MENENKTSETKYDEVNAGSYTTASLVLGIISIVGIIAHIGALWTLIFAIIGLCEASKAKKLGDESSKRTIGFILCLVATILSALAFIPLLFIGGLALSA